MDSKSQKVGLVAGEETGVVCFLPSSGEERKGKEGLFPLGIPYWSLLDFFFTVCNATVFLSCPSSQLFSSLSLDLVCGGVESQQAMLIKGLVPNCSLLLAAVASHFTAHLCAPAGLLSPSLLPSLAPVPEPVDMGRICFPFFFCSLTTCSHP